jgi:hypothetical protein
MIKLVQTLLDDSISIDTGIALSSSALYRAREPTQAEILGLRLEQLGGLAADFTLSRLVWEAMRRGELL